MSVNPYLKSNNPDSYRCLLCDLFINDKDKIAVKSDAFKSIQRNASLWSKLDQRVCDQQPYKSFHEVSLRLPKTFTETLHIHKDCAVSFRSRLKRKQKQAKKLTEIDRMCTEQGETDGGECSISLPSPTLKRFKLSQDKKSEKTCLICNQSTSDDAQPYNNGGLARCSEKTSALKLKASVARRLVDEEDHYYEAAKRIDILLHGASYDVFAADVYYH